MVVSVIGFYSMLLLKEKMHFDDSLDVFAVHGMGGIWGALATGIFASAAVGGVDGLIHGNASLMAKQVVSIAAVGGFAFTGTLILGKLVDMLMGLRVNQVEETVGLDLSQHAERAYGGSIR
jgi:Amt family ammonium transporter